jgi:hypothetical protein
VNASTAVATASQPGLKVSMVRSNMPLEEADADAADAEDQPVLRRFAAADVESSFS